ncbi:MAG: porin [Gammaproteobacteria bacterium]
MKTDQPFQEYLRHYLRSLDFIKKSIIAIAALAAAGSTLAQSNVTLYGRADIGIGSVKEAGKSTSKMIDNNLTTSRWGMRGTEDLGGGLKASFKFEQRLNLSTGEVQSPAFKGETSVGLSGGFGAVTMGRFTTVFDDVRALSNSNSVFDSNSFTPAIAGVYGSGGDYSSRFGSQIRYDLPAMGGFYGAIGYAFESATDKDDGMTALKLGYKTKELNVALGLQNEKGSDNDYAALSASYSFGAAALSGGFNSRKGNDAKGDDTEYTLGVNVPMGAFDFSVGYAASETEVGGSTTQKANGLGLGATYKMSKRTRAYAGLSKVDFKNGAGTKTGDKRIFALGLRHDF